MRLRGKSKIDETAEECAARYFGAGYNCAQSVLLAMAEKRGIDVPDKMVAACTAFTGGLGKSGCLCGALAGSSLLIGLVEDRGFARKSRTFDRTNHFHDLFKKNFGGTCCRVLRHGIGYDDPELSSHCCRITSQAAQLLDDYLFPSGTTSGEEE